MPQIATEYLRDRAQHNKTAAQWTRLYALPPNPKPVQPATSSKCSATPSQGDLIVIDDSGDRPSRRKRERVADHDGGRRKRPHRAAAGTSASASSSSPSDVIVIDD